MAKNSAQKLEWILLIHQLPPKPTNLRVRMWRKLQKLGSVAIKNSVYVLPANEKTHEDFQWLKQEIESAAGEAIVFQAASVEGATDQEIIAAFRKARDEEFAAITGNSKGWPARLVNRLGESISQSDDWQGTNRSWISCTRNWKASSPTISSAPTDAHMRSRLMSVARKQFVPRTVPSQKPLAQPSNPGHSIWRSTRVAAG